MNRFPYETADKESFPCSFCHATKFTILSKKGQDGLPLTTVVCKNCGLIFINPRMTLAWYDRYYQEEYRGKTIADGLGKQPDFDELFASMERHGNELAAQMKPFLTVPGPIAEVGSSLGGVLSGVKKTVARDVIGIEPSGPEVAYANLHGVPSHATLIEDVDVKIKNFPHCAAIICSQSLNHLLDPRMFFTWAHEHVSLDGLLVLEVMNFRHQLLKAGKFENAVKIDHVHMFTPEVLRDFVVAAGFDILHFDVDEDKSKRQLTTLERALPKVHMTCIARRSNRISFKEFSTHRSNYLRARLLLPPLVYFSYLISVRLPKIFGRQ